MDVTRSMAAWQRVGDFADWAQAAQKIGVAEATPKLPVRVGDYRRQRERRAWREPVCRSNSVTLLWVFQCCAAMLKIAKIIGEIS
jgi:hypothetical protein